jgi:hypothetical protein
MVRQNLRLTFNKVFVNKYHTTRIKLSDRAVSHNEKMIDLETFIENGAVCINFLVGGTDPFLIHILKNVSVMIQIRQA